MATSQDGRSLQLSTPLGEDYLLANHFTCSEGLNELFHMKLDLLHEEPVEGFEPTAIDAKKLLGSHMVLAAVQADGKQRFFHGMCIQFTQTSRNERFSEYRAEVVPKVWLLTQKSQSRIFQQMNVPDIITKVLAGFEFKNELQETYEPRNYCVQYRETDWDFISRLMEEEGIFYYFVHTESEHKLVLADTPASHRDCPGMASVTYALERSESEEDWTPAIYTWQMDDRLMTGKVHLRDFNFELPTNRLEADHQSKFTVGQNKDLEIYDHPGGYARKFDGIDPGGGLQANELNKIFSDRERTTTIRQQEIDVDYTVFIGSGNCAPLTAGHRFEFIDHPIGAYNVSYVLTSVHHESIQSPAYISDELVHDGYRSTFACIKHGAGAAPYRPPRKTPRPYVHGSQTAIVVGPPGEEIFTDKYGRVKVQFHWDRHGNYDNRSSCWLRVAQPWAGNLWGSMSIPRIGMEVKVEFLEGDPDQPIITGCVYNAANMPPYVLPDNKTRSVLKTNSTKGGGGFNEFRIEDKKGEEQIFVHAEKNMDIRVKNDSMETIMHDRHLIVESEQFEEVRKDKHLKVKYNHNEDIGGTMSLKIGVSHEEKVGTAFNVDAGTAVHIKAGTSAVIEAGAMLTLKVGGNFVNINSGGVFIKGTMVMINSGGAAGSGAGANPEAPKAPKEADKAEAGQRVGPQRSMPPPAPPNFAASAASIQAVRLEDNISAPAPGPPPAFPERFGQLMMHGTLQAEAARVEAQAAPALPYIQPPADVAQQPGPAPSAYIEPSANAAPPAPAPSAYIQPPGQDAAPPSASAPPAQVNYIEPAIGEAPPPPAPASPVNYIEAPVGDAPAPPAPPQPAEGISPQGASYLQGAQYSTPLIG